MVTLKFILPFQDKSVCCHS